MEKDLPTAPFRLEQHLEKEFEQRYISGWNNALEMAAYKLINDFKQAFGDDTLASIAVWLKEQKK